MKYSFLIGALSMLVIASSCSKDNDESRTELLTSSAWKFSKAGFDVNGDGFIDADLPPGYLQDCQKDNTLTFIAGGDGTVDEGTTKCDPAEPQTTSFKWSFQSGETVINFPAAVFGSLGGDVKVLKLTSTEFSISKLVNLGGATTANVVVEFKH